MRRFALLVLAFALMPAAAATLDLGAIDGVYKSRFANEDVQGEQFQSEDIMEIVRRSPSQAYVRIHLNFYNGHTCDAAGIADVKGAQLVYDSFKDSDGKRCVLTIGIKGSDLLLGDADGTCKMAMCGMRGSFDGSTFARKARRPIRYMPRILASREYADALNEYAAAHH